MNYNFRDIVKKSYFSKDEKAFIDLLLAARCSLPYPITVGTDPVKPNTAIITYVTDADSVDGYDHLFDITMEKGSYLLILDKKMHDFIENDRVKIDNLDDIKDMLSCLGIALLRKHHQKIEFPPSQDKKYMESLKYTLKLQLLVSRGEIKLSKILGNCPPEDGNDYVYEDENIRLRRPKCATQEVINTFDREGAKAFSNESV